MSYQDTQAPMEKGRSSPPLLVPCPDYQATYTVAGSALPERQTRRRARFRALTRFLHAFLFTFLIIFLAHRFVPRLFHAFGGRGGCFETHHDPVHVPDDCTLADWEFDPDGVSPVHHFEHVAQTSFDLPLDSDELFFVSHGTGNFANGFITITDDGEPGSDIVKVDVLGYYNSQHHFEELTKVCKLNPDDGKNGVGIFAPHRWSGHHDNRHRTQFSIIVRIPPSTDGSRTTVRKLTTDLAIFVHNVGDLKHTVHFNELSLSTTNTPIHVDSVVADTAGAHSTNGVISGHFNTSDSLILETTNGPITAVIGLFNDHSAATKARLHTTNGPISANVSLFATTDSSTGGLFDVSTTSTNSPVRVTIPHAPVDHVLTLAARTTNSPLDLVLHPAFEGAFALHGARWFAPRVQVSEDVADPADRGRRRDVSFRQVQRGDVSGVVRWLPADERELGLVTAETSNMVISLYL